jgi:hypothetical protein
MLSKLRPTFSCNLLFESKYFWRYIVLHFQHPPIPSLHTTIMLMHLGMLCVYFNLEWQSWNSSSHFCHEIAKLTSCFTNGDAIMLWILFVFGMLPISHIYNVVIPMYIKLILHEVISCIINYDLKMVFTFYHDYLLLRFEVGIDVCALGFLIWLHNPISFNLRNLTSMH